jgi:MFS family permease
VLGATPALLGVIEGVAESTASFVKLASGWVSDHARRRKPFVIMGYSIAALVRPLIGLSTAAWHVLVIRFADRIGKGIRSAPRDALLADSVDASFRGRAFGLHRAADHAGAVIGPVIASLLLLALADDLRTVFLLALVPGIFTVAVLTFGVREARRVEPIERTRLRVSFGELDPALRRFLLVLALFTLGNATDAFLLLRAQQLGVPVVLLPMLWAVHHVAKMASNVPGGALADRLGAKRVIAAGWVIYAATYAGFALAQTALHAWLLFVVYGLFYGLTEAPEKALVAALSRGARRGSAFGAYHFAIGMSALPASVIFGLVWQAYSPEAAFVMGATIAVVALALLLLTFRRIRVET